MNVETYTIRVNDQSLAIDAPTDLLQMNAADLILQAIELDITVNDCIFHCIKNHLVESNFNFMDLTVVEVLATAADMGVVAIEYKEFNDSYGFGFQVDQERLDKRIAELNNPLKALEKFAVA